VGFFFLLAAVAGPLQFVWVLSLLAMLGLVLA